MADIFICYSSRDSEHAMLLAQELSARGVSVWIDKQSIDGATRWSSEIAIALDECKVLILLISMSSLESKNCMKEVTIAAEADKFILPIDLEPLPLPSEFRYHLAGLQRVAYANREAIWRSVEKLINPAERHHTQPLQQIKDVLIRLAVLPFDDLSPKKDNGWFADGMMDELITTLSAFEKLRVASRSDVVYYKKHRPKAKKIAEDLNVRYLIEGSVRKAGEKIRISVSLTDTALSEQLWMKSYDGTFDDVFEFQSTVSRQIADALKLKLTPIEEKAVESNPTNNTAAYELYLKGREFHRLLTRSGYEKAFKLYEAAVAVDAKFADAYIAIGNLAATYFRECSRDPIWLQRAEANASAAESITGETVRTLWVRGEIEWQKGNSELAEQLLLKATHVDPRAYGPFNILGNIYMIEGRKEKAVQAFECVVALIENYQSYSNLIIALSSGGDRKRLEEVATKSLPIMETHLQQNPHDLAAKISYAEALFWANRKDDARREADTVAGQDDIDGNSLFNLASIYNHLQLNELHIQTLERSIRKGFREIEALKQEMHYQPEVQSRINAMIADLENIIEKERSGE